MSAGGDRLGKKEKKREKGVSSGGGKEALDQGGEKGRKHSIKRKCFGQNPKVDRRGK